jgi:hypothetical protein
VERRSAFAVAVKLQRKEPEGGDEGLILKLILSKYKYVKLIKLAQNRNH